MLLIMMNINMILITIHKHGSAHDEHNHDSDHDEHKHELGNAEITALR